jgi:hypothetical protein
MTKRIIFLFCFFTAISLLAQTRGPGARIFLLQSNRITKDTIYERVKNDLNFIKLTRDDTIADIGSYDGYYPCMYSLFSDSVVFYLNDITTEGFTKFDSMKIICSNKRGSNLTNTFNIVIGNDSCTNLPSHLFNKVILRDALHHFNSINKMLLDIKRTMKPNAHLILFETIKDNGKLNPNLCKGAMTKQELMEVMSKNKFKLENELTLANDNYWFDFVVSE